MTHRSTSGSFLALWLLVSGPALARQEVPRPSPPTPEAALGFAMGADQKLATWRQVVDYFQLVDRLSDRVAVVELGKSTLDRPLIAAVVASESTQANLPRFQALQRQVAIPDEPVAGADGADPLESSKTVVLITCSIHSTETASTLMALELLHELATKSDATTREILDNTILLLVPSVNPDGVDIVADWYARSLGKPWEGSGPPRLYHPYAGHDTNRDWFMLNLAETRHLTRFLYREWLPTITWDVHQMGPSGPRLFVPPFHDPINPNLDPRMNQAIRLAGAHMAAGLAVEGKRGVATGVMYDNWWNGGNRTVPQRHNMVGLLTEAASVRLASPIFLEPGDLRGGGRGFDDHAPSVDFVDPWPGGWWRLRDIVDYELICARSLLTLAARYRGWFQSNYRAMATSSIERGHSDPPHAWIVPIDQRDPGQAAELVQILSATGVRVLETTGDAVVGGARVAAGSWILPASQPFRPHLKDMMERQAYPRRLGPDGSPERPYDVAGWTLPLQMGVEALSITQPIGNDLPTRRSQEPVLPPRPIPGPPNPEAYVLPMNSLSDHVFVNRLLGAGVALERFAGEVAIGEEGGHASQVFPAGAIRVPATDQVRELYRATLDAPRLRPGLTSVSGPVVYRGSAEVAAVPAARLAVYQPWRPSMDEGWTRLVLEQFEFSYTSIHNEDIRAGRLRERFDVLLVPSIGAASLRDGMAPETTEPAFVGGLGAEGLAAIRSFVDEGGRLVCLENACELFIDELDLPVESSLAGKPAADFYCPGSILRVTHEPCWLTAGLPGQGSAYFAGSLAFDVEDQAKVLVACRYAASNVLESGWLLGEQHLQGKAAVVVAKLGQGDVVLFGFPPQHRGQTRATFPLLFQAIRK